MSPTNLIANTYNPHNQSPEELIDGFVVRTKEFESVYRTIKTDTMVHPPQHVIIQGRRGSGKTSFLLRVYYEVRRDASVAAWLQPLVFNEELYSVRTLYKLWEHVAEELGNEDEDFLNLPDTMQGRIESPDYEEICFEILIATLQQHKKKLLLLIDNFGDMLRKFSEREQHRLREILITCADIKIIGASSVAMESTYEYDKPFFEFFKIVDLAGLTKQETTTLLLALGEKYDKQQIRKIVEENPGKIEALRRLTDGVPRTMILLFEIFVDNAAGDSFRDLDMVLDRVTPLYKHRMDELSAQQQEIVEIIALQWDAMPVREIAQKTRMESKAVSAQLRLLEKNRIVIKKQTSTKNHLYQISERFFNIWYLMRCGRRKDKRVQWLTHFLEEWCSGEELVERAKGHLGALQGGVACEPGAYYMTEALVRTKKLSLRMKDSLTKDARSYLTNIKSLWVDQLSESDMELWEKAVKYFKQQKFDLAITTFKTIQSKDAYYYYGIGMCYEKKKDFVHSEENYLIAIKMGNVPAMLQMASLYEVEKKNVEMAEKYYLMAVEKEDAKAMLRLSFLYDLEKKNAEQAEKYLKMSCEHGYTDAMVTKAFRYYAFRKDKHVALRHIKKAWVQGIKKAFNLYFPLILLWNDELEQSTSIAKPLFDDSAILEYDFPIKQYLLLLIAKKQYNFALRLFRESPLDLRERYRPIYYALMYFMQDTLPDEFKKMGSELEETVMEIVQEIKNMAETM